VKELLARPACPPEDWLDGPLRCDERGTRMRAPARLWWWLRLGGWLVAMVSIGMIYPANIFMIYTAGIVKRVRVRRLKWRSARLVGHGQVIGVRGSEKMLDPAGGFWYTGVGFVQPGSRGRR
jgi:hypothetical protein